LKKNTIALFFCSSPWEIEDYGLLKKLISPMILDFFPEKMNEYSEDLTRSIKAEQVMSEVQRITGKR
jgi:predicted lipid-binding transport protein (Tim44 family)